MDPSSAVAWKQVERYLAASVPPYDLAELHAVTASDALMIIGNFLQRRADIPVERYVEQVGRLIDILPASQFGPRFAPIGLLDWQPDAEGGNALATVREVETGEVVTVAFRLSGEALLVLGACLSSAPLPDTAHLTACCLAEMAHWEPHQTYPIWPVTGLALAFHRLYGKLDQPLLTLPEARFTCQGRGDCCQTRFWTITTHANALRAIVQMPWETMGESGPDLQILAPSGQLTDDLNRVRLGGDAGGQCLAKLDDACSLHKAVGWQPVSNCQKYPFVFTVTPDGICVTAAFSCHTVAENVGQPIAERADDVRQRFQPVRDRQETIGDTVHLMLGGPSIAWPAYRIIEQRLLDVLDDASLSLEERLLTGSRLMMAIRQLVPGNSGPVDSQVVERVWAQPLPHLPAATSEEADALARALFEPLPAEQQLALFDGGRWDSWQLGQGRTLGAELDIAMVVRYLRTVLFRKSGLKQRGALFPWALALWSYRVWQRETLYRAASQSMQPDHALQLETVRRIELSQLHTGHRHKLTATDNAFGRTLLEPATWASLLLP